MRVSTLAPALFIGAAVAAPALGPRSDVVTEADGFGPHPSTQALNGIQHVAGGTLPNGALAKTLTPAAAATLQVIALNELFEVTYFTNVLNHLQYWGDCKDQSFAHRTFTAIKAQEEIHALGANAILAAAGQQTITGCEFLFPPKTYTAAVTLANTFTDVVLSVLPTAQLLFATDNNDEAPYVQLVGSIIAQEGEQNGWFRSQTNKVPSAAPFLTTSAGQFGYSFLKSVIADPTTCEAVKIIEKAGVTPFQPLNYVTMDSKTVTFSVPGKVNLAGKSIVYLIGATTPVTVPIQSGWGYKNGMTTFQVPASNFVRGLNVAALVTGTGQFPDAPSVAKATTNGPGIVEIDY